MHSVSIYKILKNHISKLKNYGSEAIHHALVAAVIASFIVLAENGNYLAWLDAISIRIAQASNLDVSNVKQLTPTINNKTPIVLHIGDAMFEKAFLQRSPLDKNSLSTVIQTITDMAPRTLAIDIDLSPGADEFYQFSQTQKVLDQVLSKAAKSCENESKCVVLVVPTLNASQALRYSQYEWMRERCLDGVEFAFSTLVIHQTVSISYPDSLPTLGNVAYDELQNGSDSNGLCAYIESHDADEFFKYQLLKTSPVNIKSKQFNTDYFHLLKTTHDYSYELTSSSELPINVKELVVFLGGSYGNDDQFVTSAGEFSGVFLHAAGYFTNIFPVNNIGHGAAFILDIIVGVVLGFIFVGLWQKYRATKDAFVAATTRSEHVRQYVYMRTILVINVSLMFIILLIIYYFSGALLEQQLWLNPGPLVIGMFVHGLISKDAEEHSKHENKNWKNMLKNHPDLIWQLPLILFVMFQLFLHH